jgi:ABC-type dipeptide/oligopeptide/nickel transport system permease component
MWFAITIISFLATRCVTDSAINHIISDSPIPEMDMTAKPVLRHLFGLDQPIHIHYLRWMGLVKQEDGHYHGVFQGNLGHSVWGEDLP